MTISKNVVVSWFSEELGIDLVDRADVHILKSPHRWLNSNIKTTMFGCSLTLAVEAKLIEVWGGDIDHLRVSFLNQDQITRLLLMLVWTTR